MHMAMMLWVLLIAIAVISATSQGIRKTFVDYSGVLEIPGDSLGLPTKYGSDAAHCKRDCFTVSNCTCAVFSATLGSCELRTSCRKHTVHYLVPGGHFTVYVKLPDVLPQYKEYKEKNTYSGLGSTNMAGDIRDLVVSHETCLARCSTNEECDCVVYKTKQEPGFANSDGGCWLRRDCQPEEFGSDYGFSVYVKQRGTNAAAQLVEKPSAKLLGQLAKWKAKAKKWRLASKKAEEEAEEANETAQKAEEQVEELEKKVADAESKLLSAKNIVADLAQKSKDQLEEVRKKADEAAHKFLDAKKHFKKEQAAAEAARLAAEVARLAAEARAKKAEKKTKEAGSDGLFWWARFWMILFICACCLSIILALIMGWFSKDEARELCYEQPPLNTDKEVVLTQQVNELQTLLDDRNKRLAEEEALLRAAEIRAADMAKLEPTNEHKVAMFRLEEENGDLKTIVITHKPLGFHISSYTHTVTRVFHQGDEEYGQEAVEQGVKVGMRLRQIQIGDEEMVDIIEGHGKQHKQDVNRTLHYMLNQLAPDSNNAPPRPTM